MGTDTLPVAPASRREQQGRALNQANATRATRARVRRHWKTLDRPEAGRELIELLRLRPGWASSWEIGLVLDYLPKVGSTKVAAMLKRARVKPHRTIGELTGRERDDLSEAIRSIVITYATPGA